MSPEVKVKKIEDAPSYDVNKKYVTGNGFKTTSTSMLEDVKDMSNHVTSKEYEALEKRLEEKINSNKELNTEKINNLEKSLVANMELNLEKTRTMTQESSQRIESSINEMKLKFEKEQKGQLKWFIVTVISIAGLLFKLFL